MFNRIYNYLEQFNFIYCKQFGYRIKHNIIDAIAEVTEKLRLSNKKLIPSKILDLKKSFDTLNHDILIKKLPYYGLEGKCLHWIVSYLSNRKQYVEISGVQSNFRTMNSGVPQGSILGPLLFVLYVNNLPNVVNNSEVYLFADDTTLVALDRSLEKLSDDFNAVADWLAANWLSFNMKKKTVQINFTRKSASNETILYDGKNLSSEKNWKYLGFNIDFKLGFSNHINFVRKKLRKQCGITAKTRH